MSKVTGLGYLGATITGGCEEIVEPCDDLVIRSVPEQINAGVIKRFVDPAHGNLTNRMAKTAGAKYHDPEVFRVALDR